MNPDEIERILEDFRSWLRQFSSWVSSPVSPETPAAESESVDWHSLLGQFTAVRHEVNLQTKAVRTQQEQNAATLQQLSQSLELLERSRKTAEAGEASQNEEILRPLLKTLIELHDALMLGYLEMTRLLETVLPALETEPTGEEHAAQNQPEDVEVERYWESELAGEDPGATSEPGDGAGERPLETEPQRKETSSKSEPEDIEVELPFWLRWLGAGPIVRDALRKQRAHWQAQREHWLAQHDRAEPEVEEDVAPVELPVEDEDSPAEEVLERVQQLLDSAVTGYSMGLQRVERSLRQHDLELMDCVGTPFDPESMEVLEVVTDDSQPNGAVIEEVRRGYRWRGRVFRFALVRVAKS